MYRPMPTIDGILSDWSDEHLLPDLGCIENIKPFGKTWMGWNESGLFLACRVDGRSTPFRCDPKQYWKGDNLRLCTDMRDTRDIKRGSRYCQQFYFLPSGGGKDGKSPVAGSVKVPRATENAPPVSNNLLKIAGKHIGQSYTIEAHIPAEALSGFDPAEHRRIGIFTMIEDSQLGRQYLTVGDELNWNIDPSTWATAVLTRR